ncbi:MAG TPA: ATP-dependent DNA ligase [Actinomycetota bacterium]|nr:ATP-dependent DNA ligase [Actinomycetota bacterium]
MNLPFQPPIAPMEAKSVAELPNGDGWQYEPKWDGFRAIGFRDGEVVYLSSRKELPFSRYFPEVAAALTTLDQPRLVIDGEIVIFTPDGTGLDFDSLQLRLHPAESRVRRLMSEIPASFIAFDVLALDDRDLRTVPFGERRGLLEEVMASAAAPLHLSPATDDRAAAERWLDEFVVQGLDGVVAKRLDSVYRSGEREMRKVKRIRTADCVVLGFRWAKDQRDVAVGSLLLGLYQPDGELQQVGFTSGFKADERRRLVRFLEPYRAGASPEPPPGQHWFSRWNRDKDLSYEQLRPELVAEVAFDQVTGHRIRHGARFVRWRHDKPAEACTWEQLQQPITAGVREMLEDGPA